MSAGVLEDNDIDFNDEMSEEEIRVEESNITKDAGATKNTINLGAKKKSRRNLTSAVWKDFLLIKCEDGSEQAKCKNCNKIYVYVSSKGGTSTLRRHISMCPRRKTKDIGQLLLSNQNGKMSASSQIFDQSVFRELVATAIVKHNYAFNMVEHEGFRQICEYLNFSVKHVSRNTAKTDVIKLHQKHKGLIRKRLAAVPGKICITSDMWTSVTTDGYISLTAHYIDQNWELQKLVLNFCHMPPPHSGRAIAEKLFSLLTDWGIAEKVFSLTLDNAKANATGVEELVDQLLLKDSLYCNGAYFHVRCCAHILNLIVKEGLFKVKDAVEKMRESVKYIKGSQIRKTRFLETVARLGLTNKKGLRQDVPTRWNSTFLMLESCIIYQKVFSAFKLIDGGYKHCPTTEEWEHIIMIAKFLKVFYDLTNIFSGSKYPTANLYFEGVWKIQMILKKESDNPNDYISSMAIDMQKKFDKYWRDYSPILSFAVILDPRCKLSFVNYCYERVYPATYELEVKRVRDRMNLLYLEYTLRNSKVPKNNVGESSGEVNFEFQEEEMGALQEFASSQAKGKQTNMSEFELYLLEPLLPYTKDLDILRFWQSHEFRYPELTRMARDILTIPISTVASESTFSIGGRVLDPYRSSLTPTNAEALVTTRDWVYGIGIDYLDITTIDIVEDILNIENSSSSLNASIPPEE